MNINTLHNTRMRLQQPGRPHAEVFGGRNAGRTAITPDLAVIPQAKVEPVGVIQKLEHGLQLMVTILTSPCDVQQEIQLGWRGPGSLRPGWNDRAAQGPALAAGCEAPPPSSGTGRTQ